MIPDEGQAFLSGSITGLLMREKANLSWLGEVEFVADKNGDYYAETRVALKHKDGSLTWYVVSVEPEIPTGDEQRLSMCRNCGLPTNGPNKILCEECANELPEYP